MNSKTSWATFWRISIAIAAAVTIFFHVGDATAKWEGGGFSGWSDPEASTRSSFSWSSRASIGSSCKNYLSPHKSAAGSHTVFKRGTNGRISNYATYHKNPRNPSGFQQQKRVDIAGKAHTNPNRLKIPTPHVQQTGIKGVRPAHPEEIPR